MFELTCLGIRGLYPNDLTPTSGYLITTDEANILVDCGSGVFNRLTKYVAPEKLTAIILTHYHFDHVSDIGVLSYYLQTKNVVIKVYGPNDNSPFQKLIEASPYFEFIPIFDKMEMELNGLKVNFYKMNHPIATFGVLFSYQNKKIAYTSDSNLTDNYEKLLLNADIALIDSGCLKKDWTETKPLISGYHVGYLGKKYNVKRVLVTHLNPTINSNDILNEANSEYDKCELCLLKTYSV